MIESLEFEEGIFNKIYHEIDSVFLNNEVRYIFVYGGASSSKTWSICQRLIIYALEGDENNSFVFKKISAKIDDTIFATFKKIIKGWGLLEHFIIQKHFIKCKLTGSYISFSGLDDADKVKGLEGYKKIYIDELDQIAHGDYEELETRLRGMKGQQIIGAFNPVSEFNYIKTKIFDLEKLTEIDTKSCASKFVNELGDMVILRTNYLYNIHVVGDGKGGGFVDVHTLRKFDKLKVQNINRYNVMALGLWGHLRTGGEFLKQFNESHIGNFAYNQNEPLHIVFDENVLPYLTCNVYQLHSNQLRQIDEIMLADPLNTLKDTCNEFLKRYGTNRNGLFIYGDATSRKRDTKLEKGQNFYLLIKNYLSIMKPEFRVPQANPSVVMTRGFVNAILANEVEGVTLGFDSRCRNSINDYQYCTEDEDGKVNKKVIRDKQTGQSYQEYGHATDTLRYIVFAMYLQKYKKFITG